MKTSRLAFFAGCWVVVVWWSAPSLAQDTAEQPDLRVGDKWVFRQTGTVEGRNVDRKFSRQIVEMLPENKLRIDAPMGNNVIFDTSWNPRDPARPEFYPIVFKFPLSVGLNWTYASPSGRYYLHGGFKVVAYEQITVPAGTFDCFRLEGESIYNKGSYKNMSYTTRWYCPAVKNIAKSHIERNQDMGPAAPSYRSVYDLDLIAFTPGK